MDLTKWKRLRIAASAMTLLSASIVLPLTAQTIFDGGSATTFSGLYADTGDPNFESNPYTAAGDVFSPTLNATANSIQFFGTYATGSSGSDSFTAALYSFSNGLPTTLLSISPLKDLAVTPVSEYDYTYQANLTTPFALTAGTTYFLDISDTTAPFQGFLLGFSQSATAQAFSYNSESASFANDPGDTALLDVLSTTFVPEPSTWSVLLGSLGLVCFLRERLSQLYRLYY